MYSMEEMTVREACLTEVKNITNPSRGTLWWTIFCFFFVLINFRLSAKHFSVLSCYFTKWEDSVEKRWNLKLTLNFGNDPSDTASTFLKMASADGHFLFLYEDDFDAVMSITYC